MQLSETRIPVGGNFRCCLESVGIDHLGRDVEAGDISQCLHCRAKFVLSEDKIWRRIEDENN